MFHLFHLHKCLLTQKFCFAASCSISCSMLVPRVPKGHGTYASVLVLVGSNAIPTYSRTRLSPSRGWRPPNVGTTARRSRPKPATSLTSRTPALRHHRWYAV